MIMINKKSKNNRKQHKLTLSDVIWKVDRGCIVQT